MRGFALQILHSVSLAFFCEVLFVPFFSSVVTILVLPLLGFTVYKGFGSILVISCVLLFVVGGQPAKK